MHIRSTDGVSYTTALLRLLLAKHVIGYNSIFLKDTSYYQPRYCLALNKINLGMA